MKINISGANQLYQSVKSRGASPVVGENGSARPYPVPAEGLYAESFRLMAMNLNIMLAASPRRGVVVMSAHAGDGRTSIATNLAAAVAERGQVLLVASSAPADSDYSRLIRWSRNGDMDLVPEHLRHAAAATEYKRLWLVTPEALAVNESQASVGSLVDDATHAGFTTIVDSPPAASSASAYELALEVGQALYVVRDVGDLEIHRRIHDQLMRLGVNILGLIVNEG